jgi:soluble lytic murein transglycosylase-like protein
VVDIAGSLGCALKSAPMRLGVRLSLGCAGLALLAGCSSGGGARQVPSVGYYESHAHHDYNPPGPPSDPWGPYINEASAQFDVPAQWIRQVMRVESGGHEYIDGQLTVSSAGAMGLMQLEPATYSEMASQYGLGSDPFNPYDNIMAGTAYIHAMARRASWLPMMPGRGGSAPI